MSDNENKNEALEAEGRHITAVESAADYIENFDILETITNVGNDEVFTPRKTCSMILDALPDEVWHNPDYKWLNPATKNGIFEREIALRLDDGLKDIIPDMETRRKHILQDMIFAIGQTRFTANVARRTFYYCSQANRKCDGIKAEDGHYVNGYAIGNGSWFSDEEGNIKTPNIGHTFVSDSGKPMPDNCKDEEKKKYKCKYCSINGASAYNDANQRETYAYEFIHFDGKDLLKHLQDRFFGGDRNMKFDIIIGNPPYHLSDGGAGASAMPIYQHFIQQAIALKPKYISMIVPSKWMTGGRGLDDFRTDMISDKHVRILNDFPDCKMCFPNNEIKGGVCFFLWNRDEEGMCDIYQHIGDKTIKSTRFLKEGDTDVFIRDGRLVSVYKKVIAYNGDFFSKIVSPLRPYGLRGDVFKDTAKYALPPMEKDKFSGCLTVHGLDEHLKRVQRYIPQDYPLPKKDLLNGYKLFVARNQGSGIFGETLSDPIYAGPTELCTETYVVFGPFKTEQESKNCWKYVKTKFFRAILGIRKLDQNASQSVYSYIPLVDLTKSWTDKALFDLFCLTPEEREFIETEVKEMK